MGLRTTPLDRMHRSLGARMVAFAGYDMPVQYAGVMEEHRACREGAALFDVSHMGQGVVAGADAAALETLMPADLAGLAAGRQRYSFLTNEQGGIEDDLMVARLGDGRLFLVVNASRKQADFAAIGAVAAVEQWEDRALLALQGPRAAGLLPELAGMGFMTVRQATIGGIACLVSRSGYTGEDGFEISCAGADGEALARFLLDAGAVPAGLGARDSLRLEAGLCLHGQDIDATTDPIEAGLGWAIGKRRRAEGGYPGAAVVAAALRDGPARRRVGIRPEGRAPARGGTEIHEADGAAVGRVTSGGFGPSAGGPVAMGYVPAEFAAPGTTLLLTVRERMLPARVVDLPFFPHRYAR